MNIFDLNIEDFERTVDEFLNNISEDELLEELIENGLLIDFYDEKEQYYIDENEINIWIHNEQTSNIVKLLRRKEKVDLLEAA